MQFVVHKEAKSNMGSVATFILPKKPGVEWYDFRALAQSPNGAVALLLHSTQILLVYEE